MVRFRDAVELIDENLPAGWTAWNHQGSEAYLKERGIGATVGLTERLMAYYNTPNSEVEGFESMKQINRMLIDSGSIRSRSAYRRAIWAIREEDSAALKEMYISSDVLKAEYRADLLENMIRISDVCYNQMLGQRISPYQNNVYNKETTLLLPEWNQPGRRLAANLPNWGKHRAHDGQARCPSWASSVPNLIQTDIRIKCALI